MFCCYKLRIPVYWQRKFGTVLYQGWLVWLIILQLKEQNFKPYVGKPRLLNVRAWICYSIPTAAPFATNAQCSLIQFTISPIVFIICSSKFSGETQNSLASPHLTGGCLLYFPSLLFYLSRRILTSTKESWLFHIFQLIFIYGIVNLLMLCDGGVARLLLLTPCVTLAQLDGFIQMKKGLPPLSSHPPYFFFLF